MIFNKVIKIININLKLQHKNLITFTNMLYLKKNVRVISYYYKLLFIIFY